MTRFLVALTLLLPLSARAEPQPAVLELMHYMDVTAACFDGAEDRAEAGACIGLGSDICMESEEGGFSTIGMMFCLMAEEHSWDILLNRDYGPMMQGLRAMDAEESESFPQFAARADSLRNAQRAWIELRDADCALEYAMWGAGSMRQIAGAQCGLQRTAERTIYLRFLGLAMIGEDG